MIVRTGRALATAVLFCACSASTPAPTPIPPKASPMPTRSLETEARDFAAELAAGAYDHPKTPFSSQLAGAAPPDMLAKIWHGFESQGGKLTSVGDAKSETKGEFHVVTLPLAFERAKLNLRVAFDPAGNVAGITHDAGGTWSPPPYADAAAFSEREVTVGVHALPGTLTVPNGAGPFPAVVLVHGSGPSDRDETVGGTKPFKDLAWGLASKGIIVLRYVKRSLHAPAGVVTSKDEVEDAAHEALALLRETPAVDAKQIFLLGHSQGGYMVPRVARTEPKLAGVVLMAGQARPMEDLVVEQLTYFATTIAPGDKKLAGQVEAAKAFKNSVESPRLKAEDDVALPIGKAKLKGAYFLDLRGYDAPATAAKLNKPVLVLQGERDYQVTVTDLEAWKSALGKRATVRTYPALNHLFVAGSGTPGPAEYALAGHVDARVVTDIGAFILQKR